MQLSWFVSQNPSILNLTRLAQMTNRCHGLRQEKILHILSSLKEACFLLGVPIDPEVFPWVLSVLPFQLAGEAQDGVDSKDGNELQRFVIRHGNRLAMRNQLHGVVMLWWLRCYQRHGMILSCILLPAFGFIIPQFTNNSHVNLSICSAKFVRSLWLILFRNFNSSRL